MIMHYRNKNNDYLCNHIIKMNPKKATINISKVNCKRCLYRIHKNDFNEDKDNKNQTTLSSLIF